MTYEPFVSMFNDILEFEQQAIVLYERIVNSVKDEKMKKILMEVIHDESVHAQNAKEMISILNEPE